MDDFRPLTLAATRAALHVLRADGGARTQEMVTELVDGSHVQSHVMSERSQEKYNPQRQSLPVCSEGCAWCCYASVLTTIPEVLRIAQHLRQTLTAAELEVVKARVADVANKTRELTAADRFREQIPCPMLDVASGACTVHETRPSICRAYNSCDVGACIRAFDTKNLLEPIRGNPLMQKSITAVWAGLIAACEIEGLDPGGIELSSGLHFALSEPDALERWLAGERVFDAAKTKMSRVAEASYQLPVKIAKEQVRELEGGAPLTSAPPLARDEDAARRERNRKKRARAGRT
jgi:Fe-S-cluster containining protein